MMVYTTFPLNKQGCCDSRKIYPLKNSQAVKKGAALCKMASMKKAVKYRWRPRNGCDGRSVTNILITTIQMNLCCLIPGIGTKFTWIVVIKIFSLTYHHSHPPVFHDFFYTSHFSQGCTLFYSLVVFEWISHLFVN